MQRLPDIEGREAVGTLRARRTQDRPLSKDWRDFAVTVRIEARERLLRALNSSGEVVVKQKFELETELHAGPNIKEIIYGEIDGFRDSLAKAIFEGSAFLHRGDRYVYSLVDIELFGSHYKP